MHVFIISAHSEAMSLIFQLQHDPFQLILRFRIEVFTAATSEAARSVIFLPPSTGESRAPRQLQLVLSLE